MKKFLLALTALIVLGLVVFGVRTYGARDETDAVSAKDAAKLVRTPETEDTGGRADAPEPGLRPEAGTYRYTGEGRENVSALGGSEHVFPAKIATVVALDAQDDCAWTLNVVYIKQHIEERSFCTTKAGMSDTGFERRIEFFNQTEVKKFACDDDAMRLQAGAAAGATSKFTCREGSDATSAYVATVIGPETLTVGGAKVETTHVRVASKQTGDTNGGDVQDLWYLPTGLPARFSGTLDVTTKSVIGETKFHEQYRYDLTSLVPVTDELS
jgi:hypothetical protein